MDAQVKQRGTVIYDSEYGNVCTCTREDVGSADGGYVHTFYSPTVSPDRGSGTETGSYWYTCSRCGAGAWSGL
jgi:hypothetical protein